MGTKFTEQKASVQWGTLAAVIAFLTGGFGTIALWAADSKIDEKYATDEDLKAVQEQVVSQVEVITTTVQANTRTVQATASSVDGLTLVVLDLRIRDLDEELVKLERSKRNSPNDWGERDELNLRDREKAVADLKIQRDRIFTRILEASE